MVEPSRTRRRAAYTQSFRDRQKRIMRRSIHCTRLAWSTIPFLVLAVLAGGEPQANTRQRAASVPHPLDPLSANEYAQTLQILRAAGHVNKDSRFSSLDVVDPPKSSVLAWRPGQSFSRSAFAVIRHGPQTFEAVVDLTDASVTSWTEIEGIQPSLLLEEFLGVGETLARSQDFVAALATRGFTLDEVFCAPMSLGNYGIPEHEGRRLIKSPCFALADVSPFNRPIEGLWAIVDLDTRNVVDIVDEAVIPVSDAPAALDGPSIASDRPPLKPVMLHQPNGTNVTLRGHVVEWDNWTFHYRMEKRSGLVISTVSYRDGNTDRPVLYQGAVSELFVPYMDPNGAWYSRTFMDGGEYGFGANATPLTPGFDCPTTGLLLDALVPDDLGEPFVAEDAICIFERNLGDPAWRHYDNVLGGGFEGRRAVELVTRMGATIGNYDYFIDWVLTQDGRVRGRIGATGFDGLKGVNAQSMADAGAEAETMYGTLVAPGLVATNHDHFFSIRLDVDVDGTHNSLSVDRLQTVAFDGPRKSGWVVDSRIAKTEQDALINYDPSRPASWRIINPDAEGPVGNTPGYILKPGNSVAYSLLSLDDSPQQRAGFTRHQLWVTPQVADERYAAGMYVNQSEGGLGLPAWIKANRSIQDTDIVLWYTAGFHHVPRTEDFPIMPSAWHEFELAPFNFFDRNPALDVPTEWRDRTTSGGEREPVATTPLPSR